MNTAIADHMTINCIDNIVSPATIGLCAQRLSRLQHWLDHQIDNGRLAGASVLVGRRGKIGFLSACGMADREQGKPFQTDTLARIYSMTKPLTTTAAMMLYERGHFQLDDPISHYLPEFRDTPVWAGGKEDVSATVAVQQSVTVRQLMNHTSGLTYGFMHANPVDKMYREHGIDFQSNDLSLTDMVKRLAGAPLLCQPGSQWNYGVSTDVLGRLVEVWSGQSLQQFMLEEILQPLDMHETGFTVAAKNHHRFAALYGPKGGGDMRSVGRATTTISHNKSRAALELELLDSPEASRFTREAKLYSGGGGLTGSITDYARFCQMILNGGTLNGNRLLSPVTVEYMCSNQLPNNRDLAAMGQPVWSETSYEGIGFGLGFAVVTDPIAAHTITSIGECHWGGAASTFFWLDRNQALYSVFFTQLIPSSTYPMRRELRTAVYQSIID